MKKANSYNMAPHFAVTYTYADGTRLVTTSDGENGNRFIGDKGWLLFRFSGTEPLVRIYAEVVGDQSLVQKVLDAGRAIVGL